ncbi:MAG TPA: tetratricopeptide repeat protein, partial [Mycobacteriales bacterium]|nr:tetratricopeptide repeat protein [Mycobacteriales bacterium]
VHQALLHGRPLPAPPGGADPVRPRIVPAQLPPDVAGFAGRADQLGQLDAMLAPAANPTAVVISAVSGMAGAGKTALAVHWAHRVAHRFPDGQLYVNLRGFDPGGQLMPPAEAVRGFLDALGVPADRIPTGLDAQVGLYRSLVAGRRMLVLLDNARDAAQVRPLLPGSGPPLTVVTSRDQLTPLVAAAGARPLLLDVLAAAEARELLAHRLGPARLAAEPAAVGEIVDRCARLPLALTVAASRAATNPTFPLAAIATELREARDRLDALAAGDHATDVRAVFSWSYAALAEPAARLFRLLGLHPGPDVSVPAAASLAGADPPAARRALAELVRASLLTERSPGRYAFHDLLRTYAAELTRAADPPGDRHAATGRLLDHYLHAGYAAERRIYPARDPVPPDPPGPGVTPERPADHRAALDWLGTEHRVLLASIGLASRDGFGAHVWRLAWALDTFLDRQGHWPELVDAWQPALRLADRLARAHAHRGLARAHTLLGEYPAAHRHHRAALDLSIQLGNRTAQAHSHINLAILWERQGDPEQALNHTQLALHCYRAAGHQRGQALALNGVGWCHSLLGEHRQALRYCGQALTRLQQVGDRSGEAGCWDSLGYAHHHLGRHTEAIACYRRALRLFRGVNSRHEEAATLVHLGDAEHAAGHPDRARTAWTQALRILTDLADPTTPTLQSKLNTLDPTPS